MPTSSEANPPRTVRMRTLKPHTYGHRLVPARVGEEFDAYSGHVRALLTTGVAEVIAASEAQPQTYMTRVMEAAAPLLAIAAPVKRGRRAKAIKQS